MEDEILKKQEEMIRIKIENKKIKQRRINSLVKDTNKETKFDSADYFKNRELIKN